MLSSRVRVPAKHKLEGWPSPASLPCQGLCVLCCMRTTLRLRLLPLRFASLVTDQKQFVPYMIIPAIAAALACGYQSYSRSSRCA